VLNVITLWNIDKNNSEVFTMNCLLFCSHAHIKHYFSKLFTAFKTVDARKFDCYGFAGVMVDISEQ
jgi:hypothetical protein